MIYTELTNKTMYFAYKAHEGQLDKSGVPYVFHPLHIAEQMTSEATTVLALLHDVVEDTDYSFDDVRALGVSEEIIEALALLTHDKSVPYMDYIKAIANNAMATEVKIADIIHNSDPSRAIVGDAKHVDRCKKYAEALAYLREKQKKN